MRSLTTIFTAMVALAAAANSPVSVKVSDANIERTETSIIVSMNIDAADIKLGSDREIKYTPVITDGTNRTTLPTVVIAGRNRYIQNQRHKTTTAPDILTRKKDGIRYSASAPYEQWMQQSELVLVADECNCGVTLGNENMSEIAQIDFMERVFTPVFVLETPAAELVKSRSAKGTAYIDFPVNRTTISPDYRRNPEEIAKIRASIDLVDNDPDSKITSIKIIGYASPEGSYSNNESLAEGRANSLAEYVRNLYSFESHVMHTGWVAENWEGLRDYLEKSDIENKNAILALIDDNTLAPDAREQKLKKDFPAQYAFLLREIYPGLRRSDYTVDYVVRSFTSVDEIKAIMATAPQKLSLNEIYVVANSLDPASDEYREAFELAVRMYPDDTIANTNMAAIALQRDELNSAGAYLSKAGNSPKATYLRGILAAKQSKYSEAASLLESARTQGIAEAANALQQLKDLKLID